jgi:hypothetical protein
MARTQFRAFAFFREREGAAFRSQLGVSSVC